TGRSCASGARSTIPPASGFFFAGRGLEADLGFGPAFGRGAGRPERLTSTPSRTGPSPCTRRSIQSPEPVRPLSLPPPRLPPWPLSFRDAIGSCSEPSRNLAPGEGGRHSHSFIYLYASPLRNRIEPNGRHGEPIS